MAILEFNDSEQGSALIHQVVSGLPHDNPVGDAANSLVDWLWQPPTGTLQDADLIVAYSFGNRPVPEGADPQRTQAEPGPVNAQLAAQVADLEARAGGNVPIVAQWEIARYLIDDYQLSNVTVVDQPRAADGTLDYISTQDVAERARALYPDADSVAVVAFADHAKRSVQTTENAGFQHAYVPEEASLPADYDEQSGQPFTRYREVYLVHDLIAQVGTAAIGGDWASLLPAQPPQIPLAAGTL